jgi:hypothetical protein
VNLQLALVIRTKQLKIMFIINLARHRLSGIVL